MWFECDLHLGIQVLFLFTKITCMFIFFSPVRPSLTPSPPTVTVTEGDTALLTCAVTGDPLPILMWYHMGTLIAGESETSLTLEGVREDQEGEYECLASNLAGEDQAVVTLVVNSESASFETTLYHFFILFLSFFNSLSNC